MSDEQQWSRGGKQAVLTTYVNLHRGKLGAHWLWCVIERIAAGASEAEAFAEYGYRLASAQEPQAAEWSERVLGQVIDERDCYHEAADALANVIADHLGIDIGEHSSANDPWQAALIALREAPPLATTKQPAQKQP